MHDISHFIITVSTLHRSPFFTPPPAHIHTQTYTQDPLFASARSIIRIPRGIFYKFQPLYNKYYIRVRVCVLIRAEKTGSGTLSMAGCRGASGCSLATEWGVFVGEIQSPEVNLTEFDRSQGWLILPGNTYIVFETK